MLRADTRRLGILLGVNNAKMGTSTEGVRVKRWDQVDLALIELTRMDREIRTFRPTVRDAIDQEHLQSLEACRASLLRLVARELEIADA